MARSKDRIGDYHKGFADKLIDQIKAGTAPFQKPWKPGERSLPENLTTGNRYRGGNSLYLSVAGMEKGYTDNRWATYRQIAAAGGHVRKGEKGTKVLFFSTQKVEQAKDEHGQPRLTDSGEPLYTRTETDRPYVRMYTVFNAEQAAGLPARPPASPEPEWKAHEQAEAIIEASGVDVRHEAGDRAYYNVRNDQVVLPEPGQFPSAGTYYQTALHELGHATGHPDRLNRDTLGKKFGSADYAREELRAEIAAMMTGEKIGLGHTPQNGTDYIAGWVKALEDDPREIYRAASDAEKISRYLIAPTRERLEQREAKTPQPPSPSDEPQRTREFTPSPAFQAAAAQQEAALHFNRNIERAADRALDHFGQNVQDSPPPDELIRELHGVRLGASQKAYTPQAADFRSVRAALQNYALDSKSLSRDERKSVLALADSFTNQAQSQSDHFRNLSPSQAVDRDAQPKSSPGQRFALEGEALSDRDRGTAHVVADLPDALREHEALVKAARDEDAARLEKVIDRELPLSTAIAQDATDRYNAVSELRMKRPLDQADAPSVTNADIDRVVAERTLDREHAPTR